MSRNRFAARRAARLSPILFSKVILLTAFIPLYTMQRVEGRIFKPMALTLTFALIAGTVFAIVVVPALASFAVRAKIAAHEAWIVRMLVRLYRPALAFAMRVPNVVYLVAAILLLVRRRDLLPAGQRIPAQTG